MKVVISGYIGKKITGIGRNLINLLDNANSDIEYVIYTNYDMKDDFVFRNPHVKIKTYNVTKMSSLKNLLWTTFFFPFVTIKEKADIVLIPNFTLLLLKFTPTIVIMHDLIEFNVPNKFSRLKMFYRTKIADPITAWRADRIVTVSDNSKKDIIKYLNVKKQKISVVYNGVNRDIFTKKDEMQSNRILSEKEWPYRFILYVGTIDHPGKNSLMVVKAFEILKKKGCYDGMLVLAGMPGSGYEKVKNYIAKSDYKDQIILTGYVSDDELVALYSKCDTFVFVSLYEGFGIPPLEALSCGAKVVVSDTSSLPEVVGDVGKKVNPNDIKAVTRAIYQNLKENDSDFLKKVEKHLSNYDWKILSRKLEEIIRLTGGIGED